MNIFATYNANLILGDSLIQIYLIIDTNKNILKEIKNNINYHIKYGKINIDIIKKLNQKIISLSKN